MKKLLLIVLPFTANLAYAEESHIPQKLININEELVQTYSKENENKALKLYESMNTQIEKRAEKSINDTYSQSKTFSLDFKQDERLTWAKFNLVSSFYINKGYVDASFKDKKENKDSENNFISILDEYTMSTEDNTFNKNEEIFNYNVFKLKNNMENFEKTVSNCSTKNQDKMNKCVSEKLKNSKDIFDKITLNCMNEQSVEAIQYCRINYINSDDFKKKLAIVYYNLGEILYKNN